MCSNTRFATDQALKVQNPPLLLAPRLSSSPPGLHPGSQKCRLAQIRTFSHLFALANVDCGIVLEGTAWLHCHLICLQGCEYHCSRLTYDPVFEILLQHKSATTLLHVELSCPVDVEDGGEVLGVAVKEKLWWISRHKLIAELENLRMLIKSTSCSLTCSIVSALISFPSLEAGPVRRHSLIAVNLRRERMAEIEG